MPPAPSAFQLRRLTQAARQAAAASYSPYSKVPVGAAVLADSGRIYAGCNVENSSLGLCNCAERTAIFSAVAAGERRLDAVVVYTPTLTATLPCGACRQVINEFGPEALVISTYDGLASFATDLPHLLPHAFSPSHLLTASALQPARRARKTRAKPASTPAPRRR
jgi:cytidine deaminase